MVKESKVFLAFVAVAIGFASSAFADKPSDCPDGYIWLAISDTNGGAAGNLGFDHSSLTTQSTTGHWSDALPPTSDKNYFVGGSNGYLTTPNNGSVAAGYVYKFGGNILMFGEKASVAHCSKGSSIVDFGENVIIAQGKTLSYSFPAVVNSTTKATAAMQKNSGLSFSAGVKGDNIYRVNWTLVGDNTAWVNIAYNSTVTLANWYWMGGTTDFNGKIYVKNQSAYAGVSKFYAYAPVKCQIEVEARQTITVGDAGASYDDVIIKQGGIISVPSGITMKVGKLDLDGVLTFTGNTGKLQILQSITFGDGCTISIPVNAVITVPNAVAAEVFNGFSAVLARNGITMALKLEDSSETGYKDIVIASPEGAKNKTVDIDSEMSLSCGNARYHVNVKNGATLNVVGSAGGAMPINVQGGGSVNVMAQQMLKWETIPSVWLDASAANTVSNLWVEEGTYDQAKADNVLAAQYVVTKDNHYPLINQWFDCREDARTLKLWSDRYDQKGKDGPDGTIIHYLYAHTHPILVTGGFNGKNYVSFGKRRSTNEKITLSKTDGTTFDVGSGTMGRAYFYTNEAATQGSGKQYPKPKYVFMVFGAQDGGGYALVANKALGRGGYTVDKPITTNTSASVTAWVNGTSVSPTASNTLKEDWQVVTLGLNAEFSVEGLGYCANSAGDNGGQNYAEIILVNQELTEKQRQTIEIYLAEKWGLKNSYNYPEWYLGTPTTVYGTGTVNLQTDAKLGGAFKGTINLNGNALTMEGAALPPTESVVSTDNLVAWFDPDDETKLITQTVAGKVPSTRLNWLNDKVRGFETGSLALHSRQYTRAAGIDRSAHDMGPVRTWLDYANLDGSTDYTGCLSAPRKHTGEKAFAGDAAVNVNTIIMAVDSRRGGGTAFFDGSNVNTEQSGGIKKRATSDPSTPIYQPGTGAILTGGKTYLDGIEIDGTTQGYNGRAEILSVIPNGDYPLLSFAILGNSEEEKRCGDANSWAEIEGEILLWNRALGDAERNKVEAYLAYKWLGIAQAGYSAMGDATVTGAGTVKAASVDMLPKFGAGFTGTVEVPSVTAFDFTVNTENGVTTCVNPFDLGGGTMVLSGEITVTVNGTGSRPAAGSSIKVFGWGTEPAGVTWNFVQTGTAETRGDLVKKTDGIYFEVPTSGMILLVR